MATVPAEDTIFQTQVYRALDEIRHENPHLRALLQDLTVLKGELETHQKSDLPQIHKVFHDYPLISHFDERIMHQDRELLQTVEHLRDRYYRIYSPGTGSREDKARYMQEQYALFTNHLIYFIRFTKHFQEHLKMLIRILAKAAKANDKKTVENTISNLQDMITKFIQAMHAEYVDLQKLYTITFAASSQYMLQN